MTSTARPTRTHRRGVRGAARSLCALLLLALLAPAEAAAQRIELFGGGPAQRRGRELPPVGVVRPTGEFTFTRTIYRSPYGYGRRWGGAWATDFPEADNHFITGIREWAGTNLSISDQPAQVEIMDERLFQYPLIYFVEPGFMELSDEEAARLREYVLRGGFLFFDDFWGDEEWENVATQMKKAFPEYEAKELPLTHPVFHSYLDIGEVVQVPNIYNAQRGVTSEKGGVTPFYMGIEDKDGRLFAFFARNSDLGDAWEWINDSRYPVRYGLAAYRVGINVVIYAMSH